MAAAVAAEHTSLFNTPAAGAPRRLALDRSAATWWRFSILTVLYVAQGLPYGLFSQTVPVILRSKGMSLEVIGLSSLLTLPWLFKFVWAPYIDRPPPFALQRRKPWLLLLQVLCAATLAGLAFAEGIEHLFLFLSVVMVTNLWNATQDIATDGLAIDMLHLEERGMGNALQTGGYRLGMLLGGAFVLVLIDWSSWFVALLVAASIEAVLLLPLVLAHEDPYVRPAPTDAEARGGENAKEEEEELDGWRALRSFLRTPGVPPAMLLIICFKLGDSMASGMIKPMLTDQGLTFAQIGSIVGGVGFSAALLGTIAGGAVTDLMTRRPAFVIAATFQTIGPLFYLPISRLPDATGSLGQVTLVVGVDSFLSSLGTVVLFAYQMDMSRPDFSGSDYTVLASVTVLTQGIGGALAGFSAGALGYTGHLLLSAVVTGLGGMAAVSLWRPAVAPTPKVESIDSGSGKDGVPSSV